MKLHFHLRILLSVIALSVLSVSTQAQMIDTGLASIDITPTEPIRLSGYSSRATPTDQVLAPLHAKAMAMGKDTPSVLITLDAIGVPEWLTNELAERLADTGVTRDRLAVCATHTHCAPQLDGVLPFMFMGDLPSDQDKAIKRYAKELLNKLESIARKALDERAQSQLGWTQGKVDFAVNRRVLKDGKWVGFGHQTNAPVDHSLPLMRILDSKGALKGLLVNYACHCTTMGGKTNAFHGDWAGAARKFLEEKHPGVTAMVAIGCGADANPNPRGTEALAEEHGESVATEVERLLEGPFTPITEAPQGTYDRIPLYLDPLPSPEEWKKLAEDKSKWSFFPKEMLGRLEAGEKLEEKFLYPVQTWTFGSDLAMVFLAGEVVVDYSLRLKRTFDSKRIWVNAYANDLPCYIASKRIYPEGGYEVDRSMKYYGKPNRLARDTEDRIIDEVIQQLPHEFYAKDARVLIPPPVPKEKALDTIKVHSEMNVELVAAEPLTMDPVDITWGPDLRMWVTEMADYPTGIDGKPGGRIRVLEDTDKDGIYDKSTLFLDRLPYPNSVMPWRDGALIVSAPHILFARDTDGDGLANETKVLYTGFEQGNPQHLVNGLIWGLDNWVHSSHGDGDGGVQSIATGLSLNLNGRDLRINPDTGALDAQTGQSQHGLVQDDWGNWFGCANSKPGWHFALQDHETRRNPHVRYPDPKVPLPEIAVAGPVYPTSKTLSRFNDYDKVNRFTSACGMNLYRDRLWGPAFEQNVFVCEPVHNLVSRSVLSERGTTFHSRRAPEETTSEFFSSTDNWSRPVNVRTGPDGALYIVDMYRVAIEHPQWIPEDWQRRLRLRDGHDKGRIYRITKKGIHSRDPLDLTSLNTSELVRALSSYNGWTRDTIHQLLYWSPSKKATRELKKLLSSRRAEVVPQARLHALSLLHHYGQLDDATLQQSLTFDHPGVRIHAMRLAAHYADADSTTRELIQKLTLSKNPKEQLQAAIALGTWNDQDSSRHLVALLARSKDQHLTVAALSSLIPHLDVCSVMLEAYPKLLDQISDQALEGIIATTIGEKKSRALSPILKHTAKVRNMGRLTLLLQSLSRAGTSLDKLRGSDLANDIDLLTPLLKQASVIAQNPQHTTETRAKAIALLGKNAPTRKKDIQILTSLLSPSQPPALQEKSIKQLASTAQNRFVELVLKDWRSRSPSSRRLILQNILSRTSWANELLNAIEDTPVIGKSLSAAQISSLHHHSDKEIQKLALRLLNPAESDRQKIMDSLRPALTSDGNASKGRDLFQAACSACHQIGTMGRPIGPDLTALSNQSSEHLLTAILDPNRAIDERYIQYTVETSTGISLSGVLLQESSTTVTVGTADGQSHQLSRSQIRSMESNGLSLMPEGLELAFNHKTMADLLAFLRDQSITPIVQPNENGSISLSPAAAIITGAAAMDPTTGALAWIASHDTISWQISKLSKGNYAIFFDAAVGEEYSGYPFKLSVGNEVVNGAIEYTRAQNRFRKRKFGNLTIKEDLNDMNVTFSHSMKAPSVAIREIRFAPAQ